MNAVGMPRGNGQVERYNRTILDSLATMGADTTSTDWDDNIHNLQLGLNNTFNKSLGVSPSEVMFGYRTSVVNSSPDLFTDWVDVTELRKQVVLRTQEDQQRQKQRFDVHRSNSTVFAIGDLVLVKISSIVGSGNSRKLLPKWKGPFQINKVLGADRYEVEDILGSTRSRIPYKGTYAVEHLKSWLLLEE